jgi:hypothetical protein
LPNDFAFDTASFQGVFANDIKAMRFGNMQIFDLIIDTEACSAAFRTCFDVNPIDGESFECEQAWFLYFAADGLKIKKVVEFCDKDAILKMASVSAGGKE